MFQIAHGKIAKTLRAGLSAWWVLLLIIGYSVFASRVLGTACLLSSTTGLPCPGCGMTRSVFALLRGDLAASVHFHPLLIPFIAVFAIYFFLWLTRERVPRRASAMLGVFAVVLAGTYAVRMATMFPNIAPMQLNHSSILLRIFRFIADLISSP
jgi:cytochrome bd-type quinol oxidase subunit 2